MDNYRTIAGTSTFTYEEKRSRFIATASFADSEPAALAVLENIRAANRTARHNVYAYVLRAEGRVRYSDDGEPPKTAAAPVLECIRHAGVQDVIVVVTRYFGGVLLGTGGLVRAYGAAASGALRDACLVTMQRVVECQLRVPYACFEQAQRLLAQAGAEQAGAPQFGTDVTLTWRLPAGQEKAVQTQLAELTRGAAPLTVSAPFFAPFQGRRGAKG